MTKEEYIDLIKQVGDYFMYQQERSVRHKLRKFHHGARIGMAQLKAEAKIKLHAKKQRLTERDKVDWIRTAKSSAEYKVRHRELPNDNTFVTNMFQKLKIMSTRQELRDAVDENGIMQEILRIYNEPDLEDNEPDFGDSESDCDRQIDTILAELDQPNHLEPEMDGRTVW